MIQRIDRLKKDSRPLKLRMHTNPNAWNSAAQIERMLSCSVVSNSDESPTRACHATLPH
jgi:hypothetical protein